MMFLAMIGVAYVFYKVYEGVAEVLGEKEEGEEESQEDTLYTKEVESPKVDKEDTEKEPSAFKTHMKNNDRAIESLAREQELKEYAGTNSPWV